ncbi:hypothetical protein M7I_5702 [Glarea lozoyensis 74030]|uniref:Uncharacterized protein n=1 Tax=Glarea lozoyensis (strain ATCC 74030 / MF5533) TaxID=1104152 RepID=H0ESK9_GLAL7|nr:hypothetical protein M7I_5702 [Glarea lozoyensis 74030]
MSYHHSTPSPTFTPLELETLKQMLLDAHLMARGWRAALTPSQTQTALHHCIHSFIAIYPHHYALTPSSLRVFVRQNSAFFAQPRSRQQIDAARATLADIQRATKKLAAHNANLGTAQGEAREYREVVDAAEVLMGLHFEDAFLSVKRAEEIRLWSEGVRN